MIIDKFQSNAIALHYYWLDKKANMEIAKKRLWRKKLKGLINVPALFKHLDDGHGANGWEPVGIVANLVLHKDKKKYVTIKNEKIGRYQFTARKYKYVSTISERECPTNHYYCHQIETGEDSYYGFLLFPIKGGRYFKINYSI